MIDHSFLFNHTDKSSFLTCLENMLISVDIIVNVFYSINLVWWFCKHVLFSIYLKLSQLISTPSVRVNEALFSKHTSRTVVSEAIRPTKHDDE